MNAIKTLDIIIPCFNPRQDWERVLTKAVLSTKNSLPSLALNSIILVNDGSLSGFSKSTQDHLFEAIPALQLIAYPKNQGKGFAVREGIRLSKADLQIYTDVDFPYQEQSLIEFYHLLANESVDVVVASRGDSYYDSLSGFRRILSKSLRWVNGLLFGLKIKDTQGGLKGFNAIGRDVFLETKVNRYLFDLEFIQKASKRGLRMKAVDVQLKPDIILPSPSITVLAKELHNFIQLLIWR